MRAAGTASTRRSARPWPRSCTRCRPSQSLDALLPVFDRNEVAIVFDGDEFVGLITRVDLINHLRRAR